MLSSLDPAERDVFCALVRRVAYDARDIDTTTDPCEVPDQVLGERASGA